MKNKKKSKCNFDMWAPSPKLNLKLEKNVFDTPPLSIEDLLKLYKLRDQIKTEQSHQSDQ